jgi:hypothetical protein
MTKLVPVTNGEVAPVKKGRIVPLELLIELAWENIKWVADPCGDIVAAASNEFARKADIEKAIDAAEEWLEDPYFRSLLERVEAVRQTATRADIKSEVAMLFAAWPSSKDDLTAFVPGVVAEVASERPSRLLLAAAFRHLRRKWKFRPNLAEILEVLSSEDSFDRLTSTAAWITAIPHAPRILRERLARNDYAEAHWERIDQRRRRVKALRDSPLVFEPGAYLTETHDSNCASFRKRQCDCVPAISTSTIDGVFEVDEHCNVTEKTSTPALESKT